MRSNLYVHSLHIYCTSVHYDVGCTCTDCKALLGKFVIFGYTKVQLYCMYLQKLLLRMLLFIISMHIHGP